MNDTIDLLKSLDAGCIMAVDSFNQIESYELEKDLHDVLEHYKDKHKKIQQEVSDMLREFDEKDKMPNPISQTMSRITSEFKMLVKGDSTQVAKLMMDGCNMGIQTIGENISKYRGASSEAVHLARKVIKLEEEFMSKMKEYL